MPYRMMRREPSPVRVRIGGRILLTDEEPVDLAQVSQILEGAGYQVRRCESSAAAVAALGEESFDMVIVGQGAAGFTGRAVVEKARSKNPDVPVLVLTRPAELSHEREALAPGVTLALEKPVDNEGIRELQETVARYLKPRVVVPLPGKI
jgi:CheY-like chemotaxis protein